MLNKSLKYKNLFYKIKDVYALFLLQEISCKRINQSNKTMECPFTCFIDL